MNYQVLITAEEGENKVRVAGTVDEESARKMINIFITYGCSQMTADELKQVAQSVEHQLLMQGLNHD